jgi:hypothetical protein
MNDLGYSSSNTSGGAVVEKEFVAIVNKLSLEVGTASTYSGNLSDMLCRLNNFNLKADEPMKEEPAAKKADNSILDALKSLVYRLEFTNKRNNEILSQLDKLV